MNPSASSGQARAHGARVRVRVRVKVGPPPLRRRKFQVAGSKYQGRYPLTLCTAILENPRVVRRKWNRSFRLTPWTSRRPQAWRGVALCARYAVARSTGSGRGSEGGAEGESLKSKAESQRAKSGKRKRGPAFMGQRDPPSSCDFGEARSEAGIGSHKSRSQRSKVGDPRLEYRNANGCRKRGIIRQVWLTQKETGARPVATPLIRSARLRKTDSAC